MHLAVAREASGEALKCLIKAGAIFEALDDKGATPLIYAVRANNHSNVRVLIDLGANVNHEFEKSVPLRDAIQRNYTEIVKMLLDAGAKAPELEA